MIEYLVIFFFFQAEDGIRDTSVTGVQTCALPICPQSVPANSSNRLPDEARPVGDSMSSLERFEDYAQAALDSLPPDLRARMSNVVLVVEDEPPPVERLLGV